MMMTVMMKTEDGGQNVNHGPTRLINTFPFLSIGIPGVLIPYMGFGKKLHYYYYRMKRWCTF